MKNFLEVTIYTPQEHNHSSYIQTGLVELEKKGMVNCQVQFNIKTRRGRISTETGEAKYTNHTQRKTSFYTLIDKKDKREIKFAVDLDDIPYFFSQEALNNCDFIFKRAYEDKYIEPLDQKLKRKIHPLGLSFMLQSRHRKGLFAMFWALMIMNIRFVLKFERNIIKRLYNSIIATNQHWKSAQNTRHWEDFHAYSNDVEPKIFYLKRLFPKEEDADTKAVHEQRASIVRYLRNRLGDRFVGGLKPDEMSLKLYSDCLTNLPTDPHEFLKEVKRAAIGVYTRGLKNSPGWTLPEYLSQGKCIVAEPLTTELPVQLEHGKHLMYFHSPEECADICEMLLNNPAKMQELSRNARAYYEEHVDPVANVKRIINLMLASERINE